MKAALTIAGSDPTGGAGVQADLKVFRHFGVHGLSALSALTAQNTFRVTATRPIEADFLEEQLNTLLSDIRPQALKTGMLFSPEAVWVVARMVKGFELENLVIDPVIRSSTGAPLIRQEALDVLKSELFPLARVITPNIQEASVLSGVAILSEQDMELAARELMKAGPRAVIITGGHRLPRTAPAPRETVDVLYDGSRFFRFRGTRMRGDFHGTGCAFSAAVTALLARGNSLRGAVRKAKDFMETALSGAVSLGKGMRLLDV
jgi:hydroxymethylpyrimidine/phosphomethylpyrimidine kinase